MKYLITVLILLATSSVFAADLRLPTFVVGTSPGYETGSFEGKDADGLALQVRLGYLVNTYPAFGFAIDTKYAKLNISDTANGDLAADAVSIGALFAFIVPFEPFGVPVPDGAFRGAGIPLYVGFNPYERVSFANGGSFDGNSFRVGVLLPTPWFNIQIEKNWYTYDDRSGNQPGFIPASGDIDRDSISFSIQFPIAFGHYEN